MLWNVKDGKYIKTLKGHSGAVLSVCFSYDGKYLISGSGDNTLKVWNVETGKCVQTLEGHTDYVCGVNCSCYGNIASCSDDGTVKIWE